MSVNPLRCIQGEIAKGTPMLMGLRRNVTPVKAGISGELAPAP